MKNLLLKLGIHNKESLLILLKQFFKFGIVGLSNTIISLTIYYVLMFFNINYLISNTFAFIISVCNAFYWNNKYVFVNIKKSIKQSFIKTIIAYGSTFMLSTALLYIMVDIIGISAILAPIINLCITIPLNFILNKYWTFK